MKEKYKEILEEIATSIAATMSPTPNNIIGAENPSARYDKQGKRRQKNAVLGYKYKKIW